MFPRQENKTGALTHLASTSRPANSVLRAEGGRATGQDRLGWNGNACLDLKVVVTPQSVSQSDRLDGCHSQPKHCPATQQLLNSSLTRITPETPERHQRDTRETPERDRHIKKINLSSRAVGVLAFDDLTTTQPVNMTTHQHIYIQTFLAFFLWPALVLLPFIAEFLMISTLPNCRTLIVFF